MTKTNSVESTFARAAKMVAAAIDACPILADNSEALMGMALVVIDKDAKRRRKIARLKAQGERMKARMEEEIRLGDEGLLGALNRRRSGGGIFSAVFGQSNPFMVEDEGRLAEIQANREAYFKAKDSREKAESGERTKLVLRCSHCQREMKYYESLIDAWCSAYLPALSGADCEGKLERRDLLDEVGR